VNGDISSICRGSNKFNDFENLEWLTGVTPQGMRTVVVTNYTETAEQPYPRAPGEVWTSYPDANPVRSFYPGDDRAALTPFIAFRKLGDSFKWLVCSQIPTPPPLSPHHHQNYMMTKYFQIL
jgi:hypothetical protein